ncbi:CRISPR-associated helicase Cas3' [Geomicrobium sp. JCM 19037]|uniref:CRISPR-associated helicase Cas3' n=1 Tax=Geomicrobium sp. JCM 19037 TaxID=1460634 RepID=UPI001EE68C33|nr:CRISPR-associated helicase Cas3' [Geomicrobium sp. JCM 19037]
MPKKQNHVNRSKELSEDSMFVAHYRETDKKDQCVRDHLMETKGLAEAHGAKLHMKYMAGLAGLLHDLGKYSDDFQLYLYQAVFEPEKSILQRGDVDHATAGGKLLYEKYYQKESSSHEKLLVEIVGNAIISHHGNLHDYVTPEYESQFLKRITKETLPQYEQVKQRFYEEVMSEIEFEAYVVKAVEELEQLGVYAIDGSFFITKFVFSCLVDADRTNTRAFELGISSTITTDVNPEFNRYYYTLMQYLESLKHKDNGDEPINVLRRGMSDQCDEYARKPSGIFTLSIPTGGGKTLASLRYALKHAMQFKKDRIIYIVPYTTIIEQNDQEVRDRLDATDDLLEYHSNLIDESVWDAGDRGDEFKDGHLTKKQKLKLSAEDFSASIIFTTMVQFLNVFYAKGNRNTRRLHNFSNSIIIFDEVQRVPLHCLSLFNEAVNFLHQKANSSILLCTATQPTLGDIAYKLMKNENDEIINNSPAIEESFKRVNVVDKTKQQMNNESLVVWIRESIKDWGSTLIILNTKRVVKELYGKLKSENIQVFHLSTSMCPAHRKDQLEEIKKMLEYNTPFVCVTTALIEAGVDVDFKCVIRSLTGLDSIAQAAGRCNRNGNDDSRDVFVIDHSEEELDKLIDVKVGKAISKRMIRYYIKRPSCYQHNLFGEIAMREFFEKFYEERKGVFNYTIKKYELTMTSITINTDLNGFINEYNLNNIESFPLIQKSSMTTAAKNFEAINQKTISIIVPYGNESAGGKGIIADLGGGKKIDELAITLKRSQQYSINVSEYELKILKNGNAIIPHLNEAFFELRENWYSDEYGLDLKGDGELRELMY